MIIYAIISIAAFLFICWVVTRLIMQLVITNFFEPKFHEKDSNKTPVEVGCLLALGNTAGFATILMGPLLIPVTSNTHRYESILSLVWWPIHLTLFIIIWLLSRVDSTSDSVYIRRKWMVSNYPLWSVPLVLVIEWIALVIAFKVN